MKNKMFRIVGGFSFSVATLALLTAVVLGLIAGSKIMGSVNDTISTATFSSDDYLHEREAQAEADAEPDPQSTQNAAAPKKEVSDEDREYQEKVRALLKGITDDINAFANQTKQPNINAEGLEQYLLGQTGDMRRDEYLDFLGSLRDASAGLKENAKDVSGLKSDDSKFIDWQEFLGWFVSSYLSHYADEQSRIVTEQGQVDAGHSSAVIMLEVAGGAFLVFICFVILLLLVQLEVNTRKLAESGNS